MTKLNCPHCEEPGISYTQKMFLGPARRTSCKLCHKKIGVPWISFILGVMMPSLTGMLAVRFIDSFTLSFTLLGLALVVSTWVHGQFIPLIRRE